MAENETPAARPGDVVQSRPAAGDVSVFVPKLSGAYGVVHDDGVQYVYDITPPDSSAPVPPPWGSVSVPVERLKRFLFCVEGAMLADASAFEQAVEESVADVAAAATASAAKLAAEHGVDLSAVSGSGPDGKVTKPDVIAHVEALAADEAAPPTA